MPYDVFEASNYEYEVVLQSVKTDPTQEAPVEDTILAATSGVGNGVASANAFSNASKRSRNLGPSGYSGPRVLIWSSIADRRAPMFTAPAGRSVARSRAGTLPKCGIAR